MKKFAVICAFALSALALNNQTSWGQGTKVEPALGISGTLLIRSLSWFDPLTIAKSPHQGWAIIHTRSGGIATHQTGTWDKVKKTYNLVGPVTTLVKGNYTVQKVLSTQRLAKTGTYSWRVQPTLDRVNAQDQLFGSSATLVCTVDERQQGRKKFSSFAAIPPQWESQVQPAIAFLRSDSSGWNSSSTSKYLVDLLDHPNSFVAIAASRRLATAKQLPNNFSAIIAKASGFRKSVFIAMALGSSVTVKQEDWQSANPRDLVFTLLALKTYGAFPANDPFDGKPLNGFGPSLLRVIASKVNALDGTSHDARTAKLLLKNFSI